MRCMVVMVAGVAGLLAAEAAPQAQSVVADGHRYQVIPFEAGTVSWHEAKARCEAMGGHLATIGSEAEQAVIYELVGDDRYAFLGATDEAEEGVFRWIDGTPFTYTAWSGGQPNNYGGVEHYLATYDWGEWVDVAAQDDSFWMPTAFVCEWDQVEEQ